MDKTKQARVGRSFRNTAQGLIALQFLAPLSFLAPSHVNAAPLALPELGSSGLQSNEQSTSQRDQQRLVNAVYGATQVAGAETSETQKSAVAGVAASAASSEAEEWLNRFGTARLQLNLDGGLRTDGSAFDMLLPVYNYEKYYAVWFAS